MVHSHGESWNDELIEKGIIDVMQKASISTMPTLSITNEILGNSSLSNAISKHGGFAFWAKKLGLEQLKCETRLGKEHESYCLNFIQYNFDFAVEQMTYNFPYDLLVESNIKIDVKVSRMYNKGFKYYTFNLEKKSPTCDIFVAYCIDDDKKIVKTYVIPSSVLSGKTQLSVGVIKSKYDKYLDNWELLNKYNKFYDSLSK